MHLIIKINYVGAIMSLKFNKKFAFSTLALSISLTVQAENINKKQFIQNNAPKNNSAINVLSDKGLICGTDETKQIWEPTGLTSTQLEKKVLQRKASKIAALQTNPSAKVTEEQLDLAERYYIPVVIHVYGDAHNCTEGDTSWGCVSDETIIDGLNKTNEDIQGLNTLDGPILEEFQAIRKNMNVEFVLAKLDPNGNPTTGIIRHNDGQTSGFGNIDAATETAIAEDAWDNYKYMNIYLQHDLYADEVTNNSGVAWYPSTSMSDKGVARVVYNGAYVGNNTTENFRSVLTHEFGHWLNLKHTFNDYSCSVESELFCGLSGDNVCDTPQMASSSAQDNEANCLEQATNTENFMHYTTNYAMFTQNQVERSVAALHHPARETLWTDENLVNTGLGELATGATHEWDGTGLDDLPESGTTLLEEINLSAEKDNIQYFEIEIPDNTELLYVYLDNFKQDPDMYMRLGEQPLMDSDGNWTTDYTSFNETGSAEFFKISAPKPGKYFIAVHAFSDYDNARLRVKTFDDPTLCDDCVRVTLIDEQISGTKGELKEYQVELPPSAKRALFEIPAGYSGDPDIYVKQGETVTFDDNDCAPWKAAGALESCLFDESRVDTEGAPIPVGGAYSMMIDGYSEYSGASFVVSYDMPIESAPTAKANGPYTAIETDEISFSSEGSVDNDGSIEKYTWSFGDNTNSEEANPKHSYETPGEYSVSLTVTDNFGATRTDTALVTITEATPPTPVITAAVTAHVGEPVEFNSDSSTMGDGEITSYEWNFGDLSSSSEQNPIHYFATEGTYTVALNLTDSRGKTASETMDVTVSVKAEIPKIPDVKNNSSSGSLAWLSLCLLSFGGLIRRVKKT